MKKLFSVITGMLLMGSVAFGQNMTATSKSKTETKTTTTSGNHMKKDGTPDKRYKENQHMKKDGTPDMRYKANKTNTTTTTKTTN